MSSYGKDLEEEESVKTDEALENDDLQKMIKDNCQVYYRFLFSTLVQSCLMSRLSLFSFLAIMCVRDEPACHAV